MIWFQGVGKESIAITENGCKQIKALTQTNGSWFSDNKAFHQIIEVYLCFSGKLNFSQ